MISAEYELQNKRKIQSDLCQILLLLLFVSVLVQQYIFNAPFSQYIVELICAVVGVFYIIFGNIKAGNDIFEKDGNTKFNFLSPLVATVAATVVMAYFNYSAYHTKYSGINDIHFLGAVAVFFLSMLVGSFFCFWLLYYMNQKKQKNIQKALDEEESE